jgi:predicted PurR-regulated permease PerM
VPVDRRSICYLNRLAVIIAVAVFPAYQKLSAVFGRREKLSAAVLVLAGLFLGPVVLAVGYKILTEWMELHADDAPGKPLPQ